MLIPFLLQCIRLFLRLGEMPRENSWGWQSSTRSGKGNDCRAAARVSWLVKFPDSTLIACCKTLGHVLGESSYSHNNTLCAPKFFSAKSVALVVKGICFSGKLEVNASKIKCTLKSHILKKKKKVMFIPVTLLPIIKITPLGLPISAFSYNKA